MEISRSQYFGVIILFFFIIGFIFFFSRESSTGSRFSIIPSDINNGVMKLPLWWDQSTNLYKTRISLGTYDKFRSFDVIPDTGSNILIISGPECKRCVPEMGQWDYAIGKEITSKKEIIQYGGGQVTEYIPWKSHLLDFGSQEVTFGVVTFSNVSNGSPQNVMGIQPGSSGFLSELKHYDIMFDFPRGNLIIGNIPNNISNRRLSFPMLKSPHSTSSINFVCSGISKLFVNDKEIPSEIQPKYAHFDTGTTNTIISNKLRNYIEGTFPSGIKNVKISFSGSDNIVTFSPPKKSIIEDHLPSDNLIMIGTRWISEYVFIISYQTGKILMY